MISRNCINQVAAVCSVAMPGMNAEYQRDIDQAVETAKAEGRFDLAGYFSLRAKNDAVRERGVYWLFDTVEEIVGAFNDHGAGITIENFPKHRFKSGSSLLTGSALSLTRGVRKLSLEAGWTQSTSDGIMRGGALVAARISHRGFAKETEDLLLLRLEEVPQWFSKTGERELAAFNVQSLKRHFEIFLG